MGSDSLGPKNQTVLPWHLLTTSCHFPQAEPSEFPHKSLLVDVVSYRFLSCPPPLWKISHGSRGFEGMGALAESLNAWVCPTEPFLPPDKCSAFCSIYVIISTAKATRGANSVADKTRAGNSRGLSGVKRKRNCPIVSAANSGPFAGPSKSPSRNKKKRIKLLKGCIFVAVRASTCF